METDSEPGQGSPRIWEALVSLGSPSWELGHSVFLCWELGAHLVIYCPGCSWEVVSKKHGLDSTFPTASRDSVCVYLKFRCLEFKF